MNTLVNVGRYHLVNRLTWLALPWGIMGAGVPALDAPGLVAVIAAQILVALLAVVVVSLTRSWPRSGSSSPR